MQFEVKVKYTKELPNATLKKVAEVYLLTEPVSFTDAETITTATILADIRGESVIESIKRSAFQDILHSDTGEGAWWKCTTTYTLINPDSDKETTIKNNYLVQADNVEKANATMRDFMGGMREQFEIPSIVKTQIISVIEDKVLATGLVVALEKEEEKIEEPQQSNE